MAAGTSRRRTIVASRITATATPMPNCLTVGSPLRTTPPQPARPAIATAVTSRARRRCPRNFTNAWRCDSTTGLASGPSRSRSSSPAPRRTRSRSARYAADEWRATHGCRKLAGSRDDLRPLADGRNRLRSPRHGRGCRRRRRCGRQRPARDPGGAGRPRERAAALRPALAGPAAVVTAVNGPGTQNGHIRNDTRDASRRMGGRWIGLICRRNCVASDRACTRVTLRNLHGKEAQMGTRGVDRCGAVLTDDAGPIPRRSQAYSPITHQRRGPQLRSPAYSAGT
jgi:hypothetical protein